MAATPGTNPLADFYDRLPGEGRPKRLARVAARRQIAPRRKKEADGSDPPDAHCRAAALPTPPRRPDTVARRAPT